MNKIIISVTLAAVAVFSGCKTTPTDSQMYKTAYACGTAAGLVANMTKIDDKTRNAVIDIVNTVEYYVPTNGQTFAEAWTPIASDYVAKMVEQGKITVVQGALVVKTFGVAMNGIDYLFNVRYPNARQYQELVESATHGFCTGFLVVFKQTSKTFGSNVVEYDSDAYIYLKAKANK